MITMYWVYDLPNWLFALLAIGAFVCFGLVGLTLTRDYVKRVHAVDHSHNDVVGYYLAAVTVFYGITLGLVAVSSWTNYAAVQDKVDREAQALGSLYHDVSGYPDPLRTQMQNDLRGYTREVIDHSWPLQRHGVMPMGTNAMIDTFQAHMLQFQPASMAEQVLHAEGFKQFNSLVEARRARLDSINNSLPRALWWMVILGALLSISVTFFFDMRSISMHRWMTLMMSALLGLMIFLIATLDNPFRGKVSVGPQSLERVYQQVMVK